MCAARQTWDIAISQTAYGRRTTTYELNHSAGYMSLQKEFLAAFLSLWNLKRNEYLTLSSFREESGKYRPRFFRAGSALTI
jgi:hypothetical protein